MAPSVRAPAGWPGRREPLSHGTQLLAADYRASLVPADGLFAAAAVRTTPERRCVDGVHPTPAGHGLLAEAWLKAVGIDGPSA